MAKVASHVEVAMLLSSGGSKLRMDCMYVDTLFGVVFEEGFDGGLTYILLGRLEVLSVSIFSPLITSFSGALPFPLPPFRSKLLPFRPLLILILLVTTPLVTGRAVLSLLLELVELDLDRWEVPLCDAFEGGDGRMMLLDGEAGKDDGRDCIDRRCR